MQGSRLFISAAALFVATFWATPSRAQAEVGKPRLVVVVSVDQLARWVFDEVYPHLLEGGIRRLVETGVDFVNCAYMHACTETGPGHATISTGAAAAVHGIIANDWWDRDGGREIYCVDDIEARPVGYQGASSMGPGHLLVPTLGEALKAQLGAACKVVSLSWKDRSAILMAGRAADFATWMNFDTGEFVSSSSYLQELPEWLVEFNRERHVDRFFGRAWEREDNASAFVGLVDDRAIEEADPNRQRTLPQRIDGALEQPGADYYDHLYHSPYGNALLLDLVKVAVQEEKLGQDGNPDLLYVSFSANDVVGHNFGPRSHEVRDTTLKLDRQLADLFAFLDDAVGAPYYAVMLTSDHGVCAIPEILRAKGIDAGREALVESKLRKLADRSIRKKYGPPPKGTRRWICYVSNRGLNLDLEALAARQISLEDAVGLVVEALAGLKELVHVVGSDELAADSDDQLLRALFNARNPELSEQVMFVRRENWLATTDRAGHGSPYLYDRGVPLLVMGPGISPGRRDESAVSPGLIPVLAARLLGIDPPAAAEETIPEGVLSR